MNNPLRVGVIGVGFGQKVHIPAFRTDPRCEVVAICAHTLERAERVAGQLGVRKAYGKAHEMIACKEIDVVSIAVPPSVQPDLVIAAAEAGKHVFCEKPLAVELSGAVRAVAAADKAGIKHTMDFLFPEIAAWQQVRAELETGALGRFRHVALSWRVETYAFAAGLDSWKLRARDGGGTLNQFVSHSFYYLEWLLGPVARVAANLTPRGVAGEAHADLWLELASGSPVSVSVAADAFLGSGHRLEIYGEKGTLVLENNTADYVNGFTVSVGTRGGAALSRRVSEPFSHADGRIGAASAIVHRFVDAILSGAPVKPNLADGLRVQHLIAAARASDLTGSWQSV